MEEQILSLYEDDDNFAQFIGVETYRDMRDSDPSSLDRMRNSLYFASRDGLDAVDVYNDYESFAISQGLTGDGALDSQTIHRNLQKDWKKRNVAESMYEGYESVVKENWASYEDSWTTAYLKNPSVREAANKLPNDIAKLQEELDNTPRGDASTRANLKAEIAKSRTMLRAVTIGRARAVQERLENDAEVESLRFSESLLKLRSAEGLGETVSASNFENVSQVILGSLVQSGPATPLVMATAPITGPVGLAASSGAQAFNQEMSASIEQEIAALNIDLTDLDNLDQTLSDNKEALQQAYLDGAKKAIPVSIAAMIGARDFGGRNIVTRGLRDLSGQTTLDVMGETLGQLWQTGDVDAAEVYMEAIAGIGQNIGEFGGKVGANLISQKFKDIMSNEDGSALTSEQWQQMSEAVSDEEVTELGLNPLEESLTILSKNGSTEAQAMLAELQEQTAAEVTRPKSTPIFETMAAAVEKSGEAVDNAIQKAVSISTRIGEISTTAKNMVEKIDFDTVVLSNEGTSKTDPFIDSVNRARRGMSPEEKAELNAAILNGNYALLNEMGIKNTELLQEFLADRANRIPDVAEIENYFPRKIKDRDGLRAALAKDPEGPFSEAIRKAEKAKGKPLTKEETEKAINSVLRKRAGSQPSFLKKRAIENVTPELSQFYVDPLESLRIYNHRASELIAKRKFLGDKILDPENIDQNPDINSESISQFIRENLGEMTPKQEAELTELLSSRINFRIADGLLGKIARAYKTGAALKYVSGIKTILVQLGDLSMNAYANGLRDVVGNLKSRAKFTNEFGEEVKATIDAAGIDAVDQELKEALKTKASISQVALFGLRKMDMAMKQNLLSTTARRWQRLSESAPQQLKGELSNLFGDEKFVDKIVNDLKNKKLTADLNFAFFTKISEFHPTGVSQHTKFYIDRPDLRALFVLKSFAFKRMDFIYREAIRDGVAGFTEATAGALRGNSSAVKAGGAKFGAAMGRMTKILAYMYLAETLIEMMYYQMTPREDDDERKFIDTYLDNVAGIFPFFNVWDFKRGLERGKMWEAAMDTLTPPAPIGADPLGEFVESMYEDKPYDWNELESEIPWVGQLLAEEKGKKSTSGNMFD